jgi:hypothetical protein
VNSSRIILWLLVLAEKETLELAWILLGIVDCCDFTDDCRKPGAAYGMKADDDASVDEACILIKEQHNKGHDLDIFLIIP